MGDHLRVELDVRNSVHKKKKNDEVLASFKVGCRFEEMFQGTP